MSSKRSKKNSSDRLLHSDSTSDEQSSFMGMDNGQSTRSGKKKYIIGGIIVTILLIVVAIGLVIYFKEEDKSSSENIWENIRLGSDVVPVVYHLEYTKVDRVLFNFVGFVNITLNVLNSVNTLVIHANQLNITEAIFQGVNKDEGVKPATTFFYDTNNFFVMQFTEDIQPQDGAYLYLAFNGTLNNGMKGFYRSSYIGSNNQTQYMAVTQFEPTDARMAFPCYDEPAMKANFTVVITAEESAVVLSNMLPKSTVSNGDSTQTVTFETTPRMSTYLVAFAIGELINQTTTTDDSAKTLIRVFADPGKSVQMATPLAIAAGATKAFAAALNIPYSLPKQDQLAVNDFSAGAMENWGLITYRETALLYNSTISSEADLQRAASTIAHEIAHQWTGDLVTMTWWNELFLNEAFATFLSYIGVDAVYPQWNYMESFVAGPLVGSLSVDASPNTHPIIQDVSTPAEISSMFDSITYDKGGSILRMMYNYFTPQVFLQGLTNYLRKYSYQNGNTDAFLTSVGGADMVATMGPWFRQAGYPVLSVSDELIDNNTIRFTVKQQRFFSSSSAQPSDTKWSIPLIWQASNTNGFFVDRSIMNASLDAFIITYPVAGFNYLKLNVNQTSFCRVQYSQFTWDRIVTAIQSDNFGGLAQEDRTGLWSDSFALAYADLYSWTNVLNFTSYLHNEVHLYPWTLAMSSLNGLFSLTSNAINNPNDITIIKFKASIVANLQPIACATRAKGWVSQGDHQADILTSLIFRAATTYQVCDAVIDAANLFQQYMHDYPTQNATLWPEIASTVFAVGVSTGGVTEYNFVFDLYLNAQTQADRERYLFALSNTANIDLLNSTLYLSLNDSVVRKGDAATLIRYVAQNTIGLPLSQAFFLNNLAAIDTYLSSGFGGLSRIITAVIAPVANQATLDSITNALGTNPIIKNGAAYSTYLQAVDTAKQNIAFATGTPLKQIKDFFAN